MVSNVSRVRWWKWLAVLLVSVCPLASAAHAVGGVAGPLAQAVSEGKVLFTHQTFGGTGATCEKCHHDAGRGPTVTPDGRTRPSIAGAATFFPRFNPKMGKVITLEDQVRRCVAGGLRGTPPAYDSAAMRSMIAYLTSLSQGKRMDMGGKPGQ